MTVHMIKAAKAKRELGTIIILKRGNAQGI
jgi:hypothetical protein